MNKKDNKCVFVVISGLQRSFQSPPHSPMSPCPCMAGWMSSWPMLCSPALAMATCKEFGMLFEQQLALTASPSCSSVRSFIHCSKCSEDWNGAALLRKPKTRRLQATLPQEALRSLTSCWTDLASQVLDSNPLLSLRHPEVSFHFWRTELQEPKQNWTATVL